MSEFDMIFSPITQKEFVQEFFNKKPLLLKGRKLSYAEILNTPTFYKALKECENVRAVFSNMRQASIAPNGAPDMYNSGATICATGIDLASPRLSQLAKGLKKDLQYSGLITVNSYLSPKGSGFSKHFDPRISTIVQIEGAKDWKYCESPYETSPTRRTYRSNSKEESLSKFIDENPPKSITLLPGDVLCLPAGCIHWASAAAHSLSLNIAFDYIDYGIADIVATYIKTELTKQPELRHAPFGIYDQTQKELIEKARQIVEELGKTISPKILQNQES